MNVVLYRCYRSHWIFGDPQYPSCQISGIHDCQGRGRRCFEAIGPMATIAMIQQHSDPHRTQQVHLTETRSCVHSGICGMCFGYASFDAQLERGLREIFNFLCTLVQWANSKKYGHDFHTWSLAENHMLTEVNKELIWKLFSIICRNSEATIYSHIVPIRTQHRRRKLTIKNFRV